jgi:hypothetical protein
MQTKPHASYLARPDVQAQMDRSREANGRAKLTEADVTEIRKMYARGISSRAIAQTVGMGHGHIWKIISGKLWPIKARSAQPAAQ